MPFRSKHLHVSRVDERTWRLRHALTYEGTTDTIVVPAGYETDFASVPRSLQWLAPSTGKYTLAAILHDWLCTNILGGRVYLPTPNGPDAYTLSISARDADGLFRRVMREEGVGVVQRWLLWSGVRIGAIVNRHRRPGTLRDVPALLAGAVVCAPFVLPPLLFIGVARLAYTVAEGLAGWFDGSAEPHRPSGERRPAVRPEAPPTAVREL